MLKNPFARTAAGAVVHIDEATDEMAPFACAGCGDDMSKVSASKPYSRKGSDKVIQKRGYFRHKHQEECSTGLETSLHLWAKLIIEEAMTVGLPAHRVSYRDLFRDFDTMWNFTAVTLEEWQDGIRPDVVLHHPGGRLNVEIRVTHAVNEAKAALLRERSQSCVEINLAGFDFDGTPGRKLQDAILYNAERSWIVHQLEDERTQIIRGEWHKLTEAEGIRLRRLMKSVPTLITRETRSQHEDEIQDLGHEAFIGRDIPGQHWFVAPPRNWQHVALKVYLHPMARSDGKYHYDRTPSRMTGKIHVFRNELLPREVHPEILLAAGLTVDTYGSHHQAVEAYFKMLCEEPDIEGVHPIGRRIVSYGTEPGTMIVNPDRDLYIQRRNQLRNAYEKARRRRGFDEDTFRVWCKTPLSHGRPTPRKICAEGGAQHAKLIAHIRAIENMLNGGWPVQHLLGIEEAWLRHKQATRYDKPLNHGGGPIPYGRDSRGPHPICESTHMIRARQPVQEILLAMAGRLHKTAAEADSFLQTPNQWTGGITPVEFTTDIPTLQFCINLMPNAPVFSSRYGKSFIRIW